jgi:serine/threonine protein kinase/Tfp pilus assembly protein PilF
MNACPPDLYTTLPLAAAEELDALCDAFERAWRDESQSPRLDDFFAGLAGDLQTAALLELLPIELAYRQRRGETISLPDYEMRYPAAAPYLPLWSQPATEAAAKPKTHERSLQPGDRFGKYTIVAWLGAGGMGDVYRAVDPTLGREVAIKIVHTRYQWSPEALARLSVEARALAALNHPQIVTVHELAEHQGVAFLALELLQGETLAARLRRGPIPAGETLDIADHLAAALAAAHDKQIVHRDLKPQNIFLTEEGAKILDFGLARLADGDTLPTTPLASDTSVSIASPDTRAGSRLGTTGYMSPEQIRGEAIDARTDVFALGCVLFEMLHGRQPFIKDTVYDTDAATLAAPLAMPSPADRLAADLAPLIVRCLHKSPAQRYAAARDVAADLAQVRKRQATRANRWRRLPERFALVGILLLVAVLGGWLWNQWRFDSRVRRLVAELQQHEQAKDLDRMKIVVRELQGLQARDAGGLIDKLIRGTIENDSRQEYVLGYLQLEAGTQESIDSAIEHFQNAIDEDATFAPAKVGLGECYYALSNAYRPPTEMMPMVQAAAVRALDIDPNSAAAHVLLGLYQHRYEWKWKQAKAHFDEALRLDPDLTMAHHQYGFSLVLQRQFDEGIHHLQQALAHDPDSARIHTDLALAYLYQQEWDASERELREALANDPQFFPALWARGALHMHQGKLSQARDELEAALELDDSPEAKAELAYCLAKMGDTSAAQAIAGELESRPKGQHVPAAAIAVANLGGGKQSHTTAIAHLKTATADKDEWLVWLAVDPVFADLQDDPGFQAIRSRVGLWKQQPLP